MFSSAALTTALAATVAPLITSWFRARLGCVVVLVLVNRPADVVLSLVDLLAFLPGEVSAVCGAVVCDLAVDAGLAAFEVARLACGELPGANSLSDALLLVVRADARP